MTASRSKTKHFRRPLRLRRIRVLTQFFFALLVYSQDNHKKQNSPHPQFKMNFPSLDERMWKSAIFLLVFVSLGKFCGTWRNVRPHPAPFTLCSLLSFWARFMCCFCSNGKETPRTYKNGRRRAFGLVVLHFWSASFSEKTSRASALEKSLESAKTRWIGIERWISWQECRMNVGFCCFKRTEEQEDKNYHISWDFASNPFSTSSYLSLRPHARLAPARDDGDGNYLTQFLKTIHQVTKLDGAGREVVTKTISRSAFPFYSMRKLVRKLKSYKICV